MKEEFNNTNLQEFPIYAKEFTTSVDNLKPLEHTPSKINVAHSSDKNDRETVADSGNKKKKADLNSLIKLLSVCMVTVTVGVGAIVSAPVAKVVSAFFEAQLTAIVYNVEVESDAPLKLKLENDFTNREVLLEQGVNEGVISGLKPNMQYDIKIISGEGLAQTNVKRYTVRTLKPEDVIAVDSELHSVDFISAQSLSDSATVTVNFDNGSNEWSNLSLIVKDQTGITYTVDNLISERQYQIDLLSAGFLSSRATLNITATLAETQEKQVIYENQVSLSTLETYYEYNLVKADANGFATYSFNVIDENGLWNDEVIFTARLKSETGEFEYLTDNYDFNQELTRFISTNEFESGNGVLNLQVIKNDQTYDLLNISELLVSEEWFTRESKTEFLSVDVMPAQDLSGTFVITPYFANEEGLFKQIDLQVSDVATNDSFTLEAVKNGKEYYVDLLEYQFLTSDARLSVIATTQEYSPSSSIMVDVTDIVYERDITLSYATTNYSFEIVQLAGTDNICSYKVTFVDENGVWGENPVFKVKFSSNGTYVECESGVVNELTVLISEYPSGTAIVELAVSINGVDTTLEYLSIDLVSSDWTGE